MGILNGLSINVSLSTVNGRVKAFFRSIMVHDLVRHCKNTQASASPDANREYMEIVDTYFPSGVSTSTLQTQQVHILLSFTLLLTLFT